MFSKYMDLFVTRMNFKYIDIRMYTYGLRWKSINYKHIISAGRSQGHHVVSFLFISSACLLSLIP
jgi:hypothetical protein